MHRCCLDQTQPTRSALCIRSFRFPISVTVGCDLDAVKLGQLPAPQRIAMTAMFLVRVKRPWSSMEAFPDINGSHFAVLVDLIVEKERIGKEVREVTSISLYTVYRSRPMDEAHAVNSTHNRKAYLNHF